MIGKNTTVYHPELSNIAEEAVIGDECKIHSHVWIGKKVTIGNRCRIQAFSFIPDGVTIEDDVLVAPHACFTNDKKPPSFGKNWAPIMVKKGATIGARVTILPGVTIGEKAVIGAGAVVTKNVPAGETWVGVPAKKIK